MTATRLNFRNVDAAPHDPVETWPIEAIDAAVTRGGLSDWRRMIAAVRRDPWGPVARDIEQVLEYERPYGTAELLERAIAREREARQQTEQAEVARRLRAAVEASGLSQAAFAARLGTSPSRLSTYLSGKVVPAATVLVRAEALQHRLAGRGE